MCYVKKIFHIAILLDTWPFTLNEAGENLKNLRELRSGGVRPNFDEAFIFWNWIESATGPGNFLFELGLGDGTLPRAPGTASPHN